VNQTKKNQQRKTSQSSLSIAEKYGPLYYFGVSNGLLILKSNGIAILGLWF